MGTSETRADREAQDTRPPEPPAPTLPDPGIPERRPSRWDWRRMRRVDEGPYRADP